jgi:hypothetical protein
LQSSQSYSDEFLMELWFCKFRTFSFHSLSIK